MSRKQAPESNVIHLGALRSRLVSKLTGLSMRQLQYWHGTELLPAHERPGGRGYARLYAWVDYMKLREAAKLLDQGIPTTVIRQAVPFLEQLAPDWYLLPLRGHGQRQVSIQLADRFQVLARKGFQALLPWEQVLANTLSQIQEEGPLGALRPFGDAVDMDPAVLAGAPVVRDTRLETAFIAGLRDRGYDVEDIAEVYRLSPERVSRALEFEQALAASC